VNSLFEFPSFSPSVVAEILNPVLLLKKA